MVYMHFTVFERYQILTLANAGHKPTYIARPLSCDPSTIYHLPRVEDLPARRCLDSLFMHHVMTIRTKIQIGFGFQVDLFIDDRRVVDIKSVAAFSPPLEAQMPTCLRLSDTSVGRLLINFHVKLLKQAIKGWAL